jgi:hypothetical protein
LVCHLLTLTGDGERLQGRTNGDTLWLENDK